ncbi:MULTISPECIES: CopD family protein [Acidithiobacillus]|uniref:CopD family protein n=1 Tax=Acidithiobacillus TaxID=119977 RepID=UPI001ED98C57|nr:MULTISPECIES: CopD family protein [Acidithiobacillus]MDA8176784.1 CopD family protein [Acidithiobacillus sp.]
MERSKVNACSVLALWWLLQLVVPTMMYLWLESLHLGAVLIFTGGLVLLAVVVSGWPMGDNALVFGDKQILHNVLQWDRRVTVPALGIVWVSGLALAVWGGWFGQGWLMAKIGLVMALSALHGVLSATLRKRSQDASMLQWSLLRYSPIAIAFCLLVIALLVMIKP